MRFAHVVCILLESESQQRDCFALQLANNLVQFQNSLLTLESVNLHDGVQELRMFTVYLRHIGKRLHILREARSAIPYPGFEEVVADALIEPHPARDLFHVRTERLADVSDFVDEG